ncbi:MAG TPA: DUF6178 family protein [Anaeromyxobacteraceae bacterium]|nr:DUF6178 family protein [Anaeromyxobacteraceae bacterium]
MGSQDNLPMTAAELARGRAELVTARGRERLRLILAQRDPKALVQALPADELYWTILEIGLGDAAELVRLSSPGQFRTLLDLACFAGNRPTPRRALPFLRAARSGAMHSTVAAARAKAKLALIDMELIELLLLETLRVHDLREDPDPDLVSDRFMRTPENCFIVEFLVDGADYAAIRGLIDDLYAESPFRATRLLSSVRWELQSELEESALRWRTGRLADLGYPSLEEALSWFAAPKALSGARAGLPARPPGFFLERLGKGSLLARAAARLSSPEREHLELELVTAANAAIVADAVDPGDLEAVRHAVEMARTFVELGLEEVANGDEEEASRSLAAMPVKALFHHGFGRVLKLNWRAERLLAQGRAGHPGAPFIDPPLGEALSALVRRRPLYFPGIETARETWGGIASGAFEPRAFLSSAEVHRTARALLLAEGLVDLARRLGLAPPRWDVPPSLVTLFLTALANERLGRSFVPEPIPAAELPAAARALERIEDARLLAQGEPGGLLASMARVKAEELAPIRAGEPIHPEHVTALLLNLPRH